MTALTRRSNPVARSASATSQVRYREPLTRTTSPGRSSARSSVDRRRLVGEPLRRTGPAVHRDRAVVDRRGVVADHDQPVDAELGGEPADLLVPGPLVVAELGHVAEHRDGPPPRRPSPRARAAPPRSRPGWRCTSRRSRSRRRRGRRRPSAGVETSRSSPSAGASSAIGMPELAGHRRGGEACCPPGAARAPRAVTRRAAVADDQGVRRPARARRASRRPARTSASAASPTSVTRARVRVAIAPYRAGRRR